MTRATLRRHIGLTRARRIRNRADVRGSNVAPQVKAQNPQRPFPGLGRIRSEADAYRIVEKMAQEKACARERHAHNLARA